MRPDFTIFLEEGGGGWGRISYWVVAMMCEPSKQETQEGTRQGRAYLSNNKQPGVASACWGVCWRMMPVVKGTPDLRRAQR